MREHFNISNIVIQFQEYTITYYKKIFLITKNIRKYLIINFLHSH